MKKVKPQNYVCAASVSNFATNTGSFLSDMMACALVKIYPRVMFILKVAWQYCLTWLGSPTTKAHVIHFSGSASPTIRTSFQSSAKNTSTVSLGSSCHIVKFWNTTKESVGTTVIRICLTGSLFSLCSLLSYLYISSMLPLNHCREDPLHFLNIT